MGENTNTPDNTEEEVRKAKAEAEIAKANAEKHAAEQKVKDQKSKERAKKISAVKKLPKIAKILLAIAVVVIIIVAAAVIPGVINSSNQGITVSKASLKEAVSISKLSTAEFTYNGIAEKLNDDNNVDYYIYYEATAKSGVDMDDIDFDISQESKIITVILPAINVNSPVIDESKVDFLPSNVDANLREVIDTCKADIQQEIANNPNIRKTAEDNLKSTLEALLLPIIGGEGYQLEWISASDSEGE